jgi:hypothetical protein
MSRLLGLVSAVLLLAIGLRYGLPIVDPGASEVDPWHTHVVIGASSPAEVARVLAYHRHGSSRVPSLLAPSQTGSFAVDQPGQANLGKEPNVLNITTQQDGRTNVYGFGLLAWLAPAALGLVLLCIWLWQTPSPAAILDQGIHPLPAIPPPRLRQSNP